MRPRLLLHLCLLLLGLSLQLVGRVRAEDHARGMPSLAEGGGVGRDVVILPIRGTIDMGLPAFVRRVLRDNPDAAAIVLTVDTFGGRVDAAVQIRDALLGAGPPVIAYVNHRAISAGAIICYAADTIVFSPGSSMGAATPITVGGGEVDAVDEKTTSYMRAEMRSTAEANGRRADIAEAMVDKSLMVEGIIEAGKLLTVTSDDAVRIGLADGIAGSTEELLEQIGLHRANRIEAETSWAEKLARIFTDPTVSGLLMSIGMLGLMVELYTPGLSLAGAVGVTCLALFFGGHMLAELAGWEEALILLVGLVLLAAEIFVVPGFGLAGVAGLGLIFAALSLSLVGMPLGVAWDLGLMGSALQRVLISFAATLVCLVLVLRFLPTRVLPNWLVLRTQLDSGGHDPAKAADATVRSNPDLAWLVGQQGEALTDLRLAGKARIAAHVVDVVSLHEYIVRGTPIAVLEVEGARVVVGRIDENLETKPPVSA